MCTVTFVPGARGFHVAMNRDERRTRVPGLGAALQGCRDLPAIHPSEPGGGTWIAVNAAGAVHALVNWYPVRHRPGPNPVSRGVVVLALRASATGSASDQIMRRLPLAQLAPFRAVGVFPAGRVVREWRWNARQLEVQDHPWSPRQWISSGHDEPGAQRVRAGTFATRLATGRLEAGDDLWELHASHEPEPGPYSTCMHRADAETVSFTGIEVGEDRVSMKHATDSPCRCGTLTEISVRRIVSAPPASERAQPAGTPATPK